MHQRGGAPSDSTAPSGAPPCPICGKPHDALAACSMVLPIASGDTASFQMPVAAPIDDLLGTTVGNFRIVRMLGRGGMGTVYLGEHTVIGSKVAVKFLHAHLAGDATLVERFFAEAKAANLIGHENIVSIYDLNLVPPNRYYLVMEFLDGRPLSSLVGAPMPPEIAVPILCQACDALQAAHAAGVVHRDLKPENVFLVRRAGTDHFVKLVDFGIAKLSEARSGVTAAGLVVGTPEYMAPEQWAGEQVDGRADLYALGVIAYTLATGRLPFQESSPLAYFSAHREKQPVAPRDLNPALPEPLEEVLLRALAKRADDRFQTAASLRDALRRSLDPASAPLERQRTPPPATAPTEWPAPFPPVPPPAPLVRQATAPPPAVSLGRQGTSPPAAPLGRQGTSPPAAPLGRQGTSSPAAPGPLPRQGSNIPEPCLQARVRGVGYTERTLSTADLSRAGIFLRTEPPLPPLFSKVKVALLHPQRALETEADVVRHVDDAQARSWNLPGAGFAVQFSGQSPEFREAIGRLLEGKPLASVEAVPDDPTAAALLTAWGRRATAGDPYALLQVAVDGECSEVRHKGRQALGELDGLKSRPLSERQRTELAAIREKIDTAVAQLATPARRAELDASRSNFRGVARCLSAGLSITDLAALRAQYLAAHPRNETAARLKAVSASAQVNSGHEVAALPEYEAALTLDPLSLELHQTYWALKRRLARGRGEGK